MSLRLNTAAVNSQDFVLCAGSTFMGHLIPTETGDCGISPDMGVRRRPRLLAQMRTGNGNPGVRDCTCREVDVGLAGCACTSNGVSS